MAVKDKLTDRAIRAAGPKDKPFKLFDGGGLYLLVRTDGSRYWRLKYRVDGVEKLISVGTYPEQSLSAARNARDGARALLRQQKDPSEVRQQERAARKVAAANTFEAVAREWFGKKSGTWAKSNASIIMRRLENDVFPRIGNEPVARLNGPRLLEVLRKVEERGAVESAHRIRQYISSIMRYAVQTHRLQADPTPHPEVLTAPTPERFASITDDSGIGQLMRTIRTYQGSHVVRTALQLAPLLFVRPGELRAAEWKEVDLDAAEWVIPSERMKMRRQHIVPLCTQAVALLRELHKVTGRGRYLFPSERGRTRPISENTLLAALRTLGYTKDQMTPHGFRHMASTQLHESRRWASEVIERQLAHADRNAMRSIYNAAEYLNDRTQMMQWWADRLETLAKSQEVAEQPAAKH